MILENQVQVEPNRGHGTWDSGLTLCLCDSSRDLVSAISLTLSLFCLVSPSLLPSINLFTEEEKKEKGEERRKDISSVPGIVLGIL